MSKNNQKNALKKINDVVDIIPAPEVMDFFTKLTNAYKEAKTTEREIAVIEAQKEVLLTNIEKKYDLYYKVFNRIFNERENAINKSFDIIDKGLENDDKDLISMGLKSLSKIVSSSPFGDIQKLSRMLEGNQIIEI